MTFLSLFSGIGGLDLGLERAGWRCVGQVEFDPFCRAVLSKHWPKVPQWADVRSFDAKGFGPVDAVVGGFPCQDISVAGKGAGIEGERSGLWREMYRIVAALRPLWVLAENVPALRTRGADRVLGDLEELRYACWPLVVGADDVGAPHRRKRVFIVAHAVRDDRHGPLGQAGRGRGVSPASDPLGVADTIGERRGAGSGGASDQAAARHSTQHEPAGHGAVADADVARGPAGVSGSPQSELQGHAEVSHDNRHRHRWPAGPGEPQHEWEPPRLVHTQGKRRPVQGDVVGRQCDGAGGGDAREGQSEPRLGGVPDGLPARLVSLARRCALKGFGNAVSPAVAEVIGRAILDAQQVGGVA